MRNTNLETLLKKYLETLLLEVFLDAYIEFLILQNVGLAEILGC